MTNMASYVTNEYDYYYVFTAYYTVSHKGAVKMYAENTNWIACWKHTCVLTDHLN